MSTETSDEQSSSRPKEAAMYTTEHELARSRHAELQAEAEAVTRARRLYLARRSARRAERAVRRAARASAAVY
ncbi:hypothetical protein [Blastococcus sp. TF02A-35]|uniref:hypothetical protein n=1 Tax=Blastococcus sp. TF02A-35 TaxID=2559612 RepID=UPI0010739CAF|nr:hypothetical protein [Blastococcus sp. TF02A_35]TFV52336.1 hypothetical protein E4P43_06445 [Blastococcus sp. TF02A_35]